MSTKSASRSRKRKRNANDPMVVDDGHGMEDGDAEWVPPSKRSRGADDANGAIDLVDESEDDTDILRAARELKAVSGIVPSQRGHSTSTSTSSPSRRRHKDSKIKEEHKKKSKSLKFTLKRRKNPTQHTVDATTIQRAVSHKKKNSNPTLEPGDMFPYAGPSLTRIRPMIASYPIVIPSYARWFRVDRIHPIEYQSVPGMFKDRAMQYHERYMSMRNFMVNSYRTNPRIYLTVTACRRMIAADAGAVYRVHKFLEEWGLINYQVDDGSIPEFEPPLLDYTHIDTPFGVKIALKPTGNGAQGGVEAMAKRLERSQQRKAAEKKAFKMRENLFAAAEEQNAPSGRSGSGIGCVLCGIDCSAGRYRCTFQPEMVLCSKCYDARKYPVIFETTDFVMELTRDRADGDGDGGNALNGGNGKEPMEEMATGMMDMDLLGGASAPRGDEHGDGTPWSEEERRKLNEALAKYHDDWPRVSEYVGRDSKDCIAQFLQMPIADTFMDAIEDQRDCDPKKMYHPQISHYLASSISTTDPMEHMMSFLNPHPKHTPSPFADAAHPVLGQAASLSAIVNSELVSVASNAALQFVSKQQLVSREQLGVDRVVDTKMGRGVIEEVKSGGGSSEWRNNHNGKRKGSGPEVADEYQVKFGWGSATMRLEDIIDVVDEEKSNGIDGKPRSGCSWHEYPQNVRESKAKAAGILGTTAAIAKALASRKDSHIDQLMQHLVLLQSQKVKAKLAHLEELWSVLQKEREEVEDMKQELFRERIELAKQRLEMRGSVDLEERELSSDLKHVSMK